MLFNFSFGIALSPLHYLAEIIPLIGKILNLYTQLRFDIEHFFYYTMCNQLVTHKIQETKMVTIERSIWIAAPRERVWQAVTDPEQVIQWFVPNLPGALMKRDDNGKVTVHLG